MTIRLLPSPSSLLSPRRPRHMPRPTESPRRRLRAERRQGHRGRARRDRPRVPVRRLRRLDARQDARRTFVKCAKTVIDDATDGTPLLGAFTLRKQCKSEVKKIYARRRAAMPPRRRRRSCAARRKPPSGQDEGKAQKAGVSASTRSSGQIVRHACYASPFAPDACSFDADQRVRHARSCRETVEHPERRDARRRRRAPPGVVVTNPKLLAQFGGGSFSLNQRALHAASSRRPAQQPRGDPGPGARASRAARATSRSSPRT